MGPPIGFVRLHDAVDIVGRKPFGWWRSINELCASPFGEGSGADVIALGLYPDVDYVVTMIAEACEAGEIAAAYRSVTGGADNLDRNVWQGPHWRNYFAAGEIDLDLPLLDDKRRNRRRQRE